jgi:hypothetical protein
VDVIAIQNLRFKILYEIPILYAPAMLFHKRKERKDIQKKCRRRPKKPIIILKGRRRGDRLRMSIGDGGFRDEDGNDLSSPGREIFSTTASHY